MEPAYQTTSNVSTKAATVEVGRTNRSSLEQTALANLVPLVNTPFPGVIEVISPAAPKALMLPIQTKG